MNKKSWCRVEGPYLPHYINLNDFCVYAREYIIGKKGYKAGPTNSDILNFKKSPTAKNREYRTQAIQKFKQDILNLDFKDEVIITAIPSSIVKNDSGYSNRFEDLFTELEKSEPNFIIEWPVIAKQTITASRYSNQRPKPEEIKENYRWDGFKKTSPQTLFVFDDVLISGSHFRAMSDFLRENQYNKKIIGIFWAKAKEDPFSNS